MVGEKVKMLRENSRWTQSDLAKRLGLTRSAVNAWELGLSVPSTQYIVELSTLFKVTSDYLLGIDSKLMLDISELKEDEKSIIMSLVNCLSDRRNKK